MADVGEIKYIAQIDTSAYKKGTNEIEKSNKDINKSTDDVAEKGGKNFDKLGQAGVVAGKALVAGFAFAATAVVGLVGSSVKSFAEYEQLIGGVETLFKDSSGTVQKYAEDAYKTAGLSANQYMSTVTSFSASLLQGLGGDTAKAAEIGNMAVTDMADNANKMGTSMEMIQNAYQGFAKDNFTMLDNLKLGYGGTAGEMARLINDSGVLNDGFTATAENVKDIPFDKLIEAIHQTQTEMGITGTTAKEASETISGSFNTMKSSWQNLITGMTNPDADFNKLIDQFIDSAKTFGKNVIPAIEKGLGGVVELLDGLLPIIAESLPGLFDKLLPPIIDATLGLLDALVKALPKLIPVVVNGAVKLFMGLVKALPLVLKALIAGIISLVTILAFELTKPEMLNLLLTSSLELLMALVEAIPLIIVAIADALPTIIDSVIGFLTDPKTIIALTIASVTMFTALVDAVPQILGALGSAFVTLLANLWGRIQSSFTVFAGNFGKGVGDAIKGGINGVLGWIEGRINNVIDSVNGMMKSIDKAIPGDQSGLQIGRLSIPRLAEGGIVQARPGGILANIGEGGEDEAVIPLSKLDKIMSGDYGNDNPTYQITIPISGAIVTSPQDQRKFAEVIGKKINEVMQQKGYKPALEGM